MITFAPQFCFAGFERGHYESPSFMVTGDMIDTENVRKYVDEFLDGTSIFVVEIKVTPHNKIMVYVDGDQGVTIEDCSKLSRHIERELDRDLEDFELEVSSVGVGHPLQLVRQYHNNIGRRLAVVTNDEQIIKGKLTEVTEQGIVIEKDKPAKGKKKKKDPETDIHDRMFIQFVEIREAKVQVSFK